ncbi:hypothetical protein OO010_03460 [Flavobacteriaceae bacterium KMM 6898]|nr:hypothetical protein [Flavobacteriaceae bacterium KMM 6898]
MKILGIRNSPKVIRFCILEGNATSFNFSNSNGENKIDLPKSLQTEAEIYQWVKSEFSRLFDKYGPFDHMAIKQNENVPTRYSSVKPVMFLDCIACLIAVDNNTPFTSHLYTSLGTKSKEVVQYAESQISKSNSHWDSKIADAIAAAIKNLK